MKRCYPLLLMAAVLALLSFPLAAEPPLRFGVFPYLSPAKLIDFHAPLRDYLRGTLGQSVVMVTAPNFAEFRKRTREGDYDLVLTAPHLGRLAEKEGGLQRVALSANRSQAVFVTRSDSGIRSLADLRGRSVTVPPARAIIHQLALDSLREQGLKPDQDVSILATQSHNNAMMAAINGDSDAAAFGLPTWLRYQAPNKDQLTVIGRSTEIPGFAVMAHRDMPDGQLERIRQALSVFGRTPAGQHYLARTGLKAFTTVKDGELESLDRYIEVIFGL